MDLTTAVVVLALLFALSAGFHDAGISVAGLVLTRAGRPAPALVLAGVASAVGPLVAGAAVAATTANLVTITGAPVVPVLAAGLTSAVVWNVATWRLAIPSSASHAMVGGLTGAALAAGGASAVAWGGLDGFRPVGVLGTLLALVVAPVLGVLAGGGLAMASRRLLRRADRRVDRPIRRSEWVASALVAGAIGANDGAKAIGMIGAVLLATGRTATFTPPGWAAPAAGLALAVGVVTGGWGIVGTVGRRIFRIRPLDGLVVEAGSLGVLAGATALGAPISTTQVVTSSVVGVGVGRRRAHHVQWAMVRSIALAWVTTLPATGIMAAMALPLWRWVA